MPKRISVNIGYVTNSSSVVHHFERALLEHPKVAAFIKKFEIGEGFVGDDLWDREECTTFAVTKEQKAQVQREFTHGGYEDYRSPTVDVESDDVVIVFGDEYDTIASQLCRLLCEVLNEKDGSDRSIYGGQSYN